MATDRIRTLVDDTLDGDIALNDHNPELVTAIRAVARAARIVADACDDIDRRLNVISNRLYQLFAAIATSVIAGVILFVIVNR